MNEKAYKTLAKACGARKRCEASNNTEWFDKWTETIEAILEDFPSGSGFDRGTTIDLDLSGEDKLVFNTDFHHMNDGGMYDGWTSHVVTVTPSLGLDFHIKVSSRDRNGIKEHIVEMFSNALNSTPISQTEAA